MYMANPFEAITIAWTGAHIFARTPIPTLQYPLMAAILAVVAALYGTYAQYDFSSGWLIRYTSLTSFLLSKRQTC